MRKITKSFGKLCKIFLKKLVKKFAQFKKMYYFCRRFRRLMTSLPCNSCNYREISSPIKIL